MIHVEGKGQKKKKMLLIFYHTKREKVLTALSHFTIKRGSL